MQFPIRRYLACGMLPFCPMTAVSTVEEALRKHPFTHGLSAEQVDALASFCSELSFQEDDLVLVAGQRSNAFYLLLSGSVVVEMHTPHFNVCLQAVGPGDAFGWSALLDHHDTLFQVRAREDTSALRLDGASLLAACRSDASLGVEMYRRALDVAAKRVRATEERFAELCGVHVDPRLSTP